MSGRSVMARALAATALAVIGLTPTVASAPGAHAAVSNLSPARNNIDFQTIPVGQLSEQDVQVTNTAATALQIDLTTSSNANGSIDFFPGPAVNASGIGTCLDLNLTPAMIPPQQSCTLGVYFLPTHFGLRTTTMTIADNTGGAFDLTLSGTGVAGYYIAAAGAEYATLGFAAHDFESNGIPLNQPVVGIAATPDGDGFWLTATDGGVFTVGDARFFGSTGNIRLNQPVVGMAPTPSGDGYWLVASDGGIFTFGDAGFQGSLGGVRLFAPVVGVGHD